MPKTFSFSNKGNYWKTRYSFLPCQYSHINKNMYSYPVNVISGENDATDKSVGWIHQYGAERCRWYNNQSTSAVAFTFNDYVSANKMYRSLSIEGTDNLSPTALLTVNNSRSAGQVKPSVALGFNQKGGIMYSGLAGSQLRSNKSITPLGTIVSTDAVDYSAGRMTLSLEMQWIKGAKAKIFNSPTQTTGLFTIDWSDQGQISKFTFPSGTGSPAALANWQSADTSIFNTALTTVGASNFDGRNGFLVSIDFNDALDKGYIESLPADISEASAILIDQAGNTWGFGALGNGIGLVSLTPDNVNGAKPQGQYADMVVTLGSNDYEVFAFNAYYEANTLDHSK